MEILEYALVLLACVIVSAVLGQVIRRVSLPLVQIAVGCIVALLLRSVADVPIGSELFLVLFIAPLLFNEARQTDRRALWDNKGSILLLAVGLVFMTVLVVGFMLNLIVPGIPLAAAFACAAALGPTDAAAVGALGSSVSLKRRQRLLLSGESLINDASGVVAFQFAIAAALTGAFSVMDVGERFLVLFFGGIAAGAVMGALAMGSMAVLRRRGFENTTVHVLYEVFTPFVVYLSAEWIQVSGILAVVMAGLIMADTTPRLTSTDAARRQMVSDGFWKIIVFLINSVVFIMLGMELPLAFSPAMADYFDPWELVGLVLLVTVLIGLCRFAWAAAMELFHKSKDRGTRGISRPKQALRNALVLTLAGPKGAVTLSIIFTIPFTLADGSPFPGRDLIIFLTAGVILCTLLSAEIFLPHLAPPSRCPKKVCEDSLNRATVEVLEGTVRELRRQLDSGAAPEYIPALRLTQARYSARLARERRSLNKDGAAIRRLSDEALKVQQRRADALQSETDGDYRLSELTPYYATLRSIRRSVGYFGKASTVGSRFSTLKGRIALLWQQAKPDGAHSVVDAAVYYRTCLFAIELEKAAIEYLRGVEALGGPDADAAKVLIEEHQAAVNSLWGRISYGRDIPERAMPLELGPKVEVPEGMDEKFDDQFIKAARYAEEVDANALMVELEQIRHLLEQGRISEAVARNLRQRVYVLQMTLDG